MALDTGRRAARTLAACVGVPAVSARVTQGSERVGAGWQGCGAGAGTMAESRHDYGPVARLEAEAIGEPGRRTFRVLAANDSRAASLWLEKEQLAALGRAIETQLGRLRALRADRDTPSPDPGGGYQGQPALDFRVGQLALGFDEREGMFLLLAYTVDDADEDRPTFSCQGTPAQFRSLASLIEKVVAGGRPACPLCGLPMDPSGHVCIRTNGYFKREIPPLQTESDDD